MMAVGDELRRQWRGILHAVGEGHENLTVAHRHARRFRGCLQQAGRLLRRSRQPKADHRPAADLCQQVLHIATGQQAAVFDDADPIADVRQLRKDVAGDEDRLAQTLQPLQQSAHLDPRPRIETAGRFVEEQHLRVVQQHAGEAQSLGHAAGKTGHQFVPLEGEIHQLERPLRHASPLGPVDPIGGREELQVFDHPHVVVDAENVGHVADRPTDLAGMRVDRVAADVGLSPCRGEERGEDADRGRLSGAVGPDEAEKIPLFKFQVERLEGVEVAIFLGQVDCFDHGNNPLEEAAGPEAAATGRTSGITIRQRAAWPGMGGTCADVLVSPSDCGWQRQSTMAGPRPTSTARSSGRSGDRSNRPSRPDSRDV